MGCQVKRVILARRAYQDLLEVQENLELQVFQGCLGSKEIKEYLVYLGVMDQ